MTISGELALTKKSNNIITMTSCQQKKKNKSFYLKSEGTEFWRFLYLDFKNN